MNLPFCGSDVGSRSEVWTGQVDFHNQNRRYPSTIFTVSRSQASVLLNLGIIDDLQQKSVEKGRKDVEKSLKRLRKLPEVADCEQERSCFRES